MILHMLSNLRSYLRHFELYDEQANPREDVDIFAWPEICLVRLGPRVWWVLVVRSVVFQAFTVLFAPVPRAHHLVGSLRPAEGVRLSAQVSGVLGVLGRVSPTGGDCEHGEQVRDEPRGL